MRTATLYAPGATVQILDSVPTTPPPSTFTLKRLSPANITTPYGGYGGQFSIGTILPGGKVHEIWRGTNEFDDVTGAWNTDQVSMADGSGVPTIPENFGQCYVPAEGVVYQGTESPGGVFSKFNPTTGVYTPIPNISTAGDSCLLFDAARNRLLSCGGFTAFSMRAIALPASAPAVTIPLGNAPIVTKDYAEHGLYRGSISPDGRVGYFGDNNALSEWDGVSPNWVSRPFTGEKPPNNTHWIYYWPLDWYIGWCGSDVVAGGGVPGPVVAAFYVIPRSTWVCQKPAYTGGNPTACSLASAFLLADPEHKQVLLFNFHGYVELWALSLA